VKAKLSKSVHDAGWDQLRLQLISKARWAGKHLVVVGRLFPSSRLGRACGAVNDALTRADHVWTCACGATHDRDLNASGNIRDRGLRLLAGLVPRRGITPPECWSDSPRASTAR
jgi:putative transposase